MSTALIAWLDASSGDSEITVAGRSKRSRASRKRVGAERALAVRQMVLFVAVRVGDVREVDVERGVRLEHIVDRFERIGEEAASRYAPSLVACMCAKSSTGRTQPVPGRDLDDVVNRAEIAYATHHLDAERNSAALSLEALAERRRAARRPTAIASSRARPRRKPGMEDDDLGPARGRDTRTAVERADRGRELLVRCLDVAHEAEERCVHRQRHVGIAGDRTEPLGPRVVHPEATLEVDLARVVATLEKQRRRLPGALARGIAAGPTRIAKRADFPRRDAQHCGYRPMSSDCPLVCFRVHCPEQPTRIDLLELDIDLRLADLWREAADVTEWNLEVVSAFMRAAYGKGYCDAFTEDSPGSLCHDHGYRDSRAAAVRPRRLTRFVCSAGRCRPRPAILHGVARKRTPARLVIALSIAAVLAVFLLYTRSQVAARRRCGRASSHAHRELSRSSARSSASRRAMHTQAGCGSCSVTSRIRRARPCAVLYTGSVPDLFAVRPRHRRHGTLAERHVRRDSRLAGDEVPLEVHGHARPTAVDG